ncbi:hypothetical protein F383_30287 [Gossypium arboreum]|uniref:Uncharacterized protein n=1 Tax=Gossypium arboreum TaxID=29729 RepID=A0A0B0PD54_GOSAR|nr:hypothetical protein F383_30287 [Gossypium arboreum]
MVQQVMNDVVEKEIIEVSLDSGIVRKHHHTINHFVGTFEALYIWYMACIG